MYPLRKLVTNGHFSFDRLDIKRYEKPPFHIKRADGHHSQAFRHLKKAKMKLRPQLVAPDAVPAVLAQLRNWLTWDLLPNEIPGKKPRKVPFYANGSPREGAQGTTSDRAQLVTLSEALEAAQRYGRTGLGLAILPDSGIVALDFDNCITDGVIDQRVLNLCSPTYTEVSPSGTGLRAFMRGSCLSRKDSKGDKGAFGVEVFGHNGFVTFTGNVLEDCKLFGTDMVVCELTPEVTRMYTDRFGSMTAASTALSVTGDDDNFLLSLSPTLGLTLAMCREVLLQINPTTDYEEWNDCLMRLHHETGGSDAGLKLAIEWSSGGENFGGERDVASHWRSFGKGNKRPKTFKGLISKVKHVSPEIAQLVYLDLVDMTDTGNANLLRKQPANTG